MKREIFIDKLEPIKDAQHFFSTDKILAVDIFPVDEMPISNLEKIKLKVSNKGFKHDDKLYLPVFLKGSPENLFLNNGWPYKIGNMDVIIFFDGDLKGILNQKKIYDISHCYTKKNITCSFSHDFMVERYILPNMGKRNKTPPAKALFPGGVLIQTI